MKKNVFLHHAGGLKITS